MARCQVLGIEHRDQAGEGMFGFRRRARFKVLGNYSARLPDCRNQ
jgi:hypothetical protein